MTEQLPTNRPRLKFTAAERRDNVPLIAVWELTLACNLRCGHCGSRAGKRRDDELTTAEALDLVDQMGRLGVIELSIIGGEAHLRKDWLDIVRQATSWGICCTMQTGGYNLSAEKLRQAQEAGVRDLGVSIDGLADLHDRVRGVKGSYADAIQTLRYARQLGLTTGVNTQIGAETAADLPGLVDVLIEEGVKAWRCQLTAPMGNAADNDGLLLQPYELGEVIPLIARLYQKARSHGINALAGNNVGFFGPSETVLRPGDFHWSSCGAGQNVLAFEANGTIKSCPSLATASFAAGNIRDMSLEEAWLHSPVMHWARVRTTEDLWGFCGTCYYRQTCYAGCTWMGHSLFGKTGNNPWCEHRVHELAKQGLRERVVKVRDAADTPFAIGEFALITEPIPGREAEQSETRTDFAPQGAGPLIQIQLGPEATGGRPTLDLALTPPPGKVVKRMKLCPACDRHMLVREDACPHCSHAMPEWRRPSAVVAAASRVV